MILASILVAVSSSLHSQIIVNVGFRVGYVIGTESGFISGMDISVTAPTGGFPRAAGVYFSVESRPNLDVTHFGVEAFPTYWTGIAVGLSRIRHYEDHDTGIHGMVFGGMFALPYYQITVPTHLPTMHAFGTFLKLPIPVGFTDLSVG